MAGSEGGIGDGSAGGFGGGFGGMGGGFNSAQDSQAANAAMGFGPNSGFAGFNSVAKGMAGMFGMQPGFAATAVNFGLGKLSGGLSTAVGFASDMAGRNNNNGTNSIGGGVGAGGMGGDNGGGVGGSFGQIQGVPMSANGVPNTYIQGQSGDPLWESILSSFNAQHAAQQGGPMNRPWGSDADAMNAKAALDAAYLAQKGGAAPGVPGAAPGVPAPAVPSEEQALRMAQLGLVQQQQGIASEMLRRQNLLEPALLKAQGFEQILGQNGEVTGYKQSQAGIDEASQNEEIANMMRTRTLAALKGELPVDPALERDIAENRRTLQDTLRHQLGTGGEISTPGIETLANYDKRAEELRQASRMDQLKTGEATRLSAESINSTSSQQNLDSILNLFKSNTNSANIFSQASQGLVSPSQNSVENNKILAQLQLGNLDAATREKIANIQANAQMSSAQTGANAQTSASNSAGWGQAAGALFGSDIFGDLMGNVLDWF